MGVLFRWLLGIVGFGIVIKALSVLTLRVLLVANWELVDCFVGLAVAAEKVTDHNYLIDLLLHEEACSLILAANCYS